MNVIVFNSIEILSKLDRIVRYAAVRRRRRGDVNKGGRSPSTRGGTAAARLGKQKRYTTRAATGVWVFTDNTAQ